MSAFVRSKTMATISGHWRKSHQPPKLPLSWADVKGGSNGASAVDADNRLVARIEPKGEMFVLTVDGWLWRVAGDRGTARFNAVLAADPDPRDKFVTEKPVKEFTTLAAAKAEAIATMWWPAQRA